MGYSRAEGEVTMMCWKETMEIKPRKRECAMRRFPYRVFRPCD